MPEYSTCSRFSLVQLHAEERKQQAHLQKVSEMQRRHGLDTSAPTRFPHIRRGFLAKSNERRQEIDKENQVKSKKLITIMRTKSVPPQPPFHPVSTNRRHLSVNLSQDNADYRERLAKVKGKYDAREWRKEYQQHQDYLKISKDNKVFTPLDIAIHRQRSIKLNSSMNSKVITPASSIITLSKRAGPNN